MIQNSYELLAALKNMGYIKNERDPLWWPRSGTLPVVFGALLTQQARWENVEASLQNLQNAGLDSLESIVQSPAEALIPLIKPSGFYNTKAQRLQMMCRNILEEFGSFGNFRENVDREWLLRQKGIGMESADSILCYACSREAYVVDSYTGRLLESLSYRFENYTEIQEWMIAGLDENIDKVRLLYKDEIPLHQIYARLHGKIVEFAKENIRGKKVDLSRLESY